MLLPIIGVPMGFTALYIIGICVGTGLLYNKGMIGLVSFPIYEELVKLAITGAFIYLFDLEFRDSLILGFSTGVGFRIFEMTIKAWSVFNFIVPAILHAEWVCVSLVGVLHYRDFKSMKKIGYVFLSIALHLGWNIMVT